MCKSCLKTARSFPLLVYNVALRHENGSLAKMSRRTGVSQATLIRWVFGWELPTPPAQAAGVVIPFARRERRP